MEMFDAIIFLMMHFKHNWYRLKITFFFVGNVAGENNVQQEQSQFNQHSPHEDNSNALPVPDAAPIFFNPNQFQGQPIQTPNM